MMLTAKTAEIDLILDIEKGIIIKVDQLLITRLLINLLSNGIKYGEKGGFVKLSVTSEKNQLVCHVSDNGIGIAEEDLDKIWDRLYQVNPSRTAGKTESMGFGLSMAKWIVEAHHGTLTVQSEFGKGSTFTFKIPFSQTLVSNK
jgi:signal transduction histidine kinase